MPLTDTDLPLFIELLADATSVGKSFAAWRIRHHLDQAGIPSVMVRIETRGVRVPLRQGDVMIAVEDFAHAMAPAATCLSLGSVLVSRASYFS
jgi:hypothetical protein